MAKKLQNKVGPPVEDENFFGRDREIAETWADLHDGNHILITAPRRVGKSSLVKRLIKEARNKGWKAAYIDVQEITDEIGFFKIFVETLRAENESWFTKKKAKAIQGLNDLLGKLELEWKTEAGAVKFKWSGIKTLEVFEEIKKLLQDVGDLLIVIDELPFFLARIENGEDSRERISDFLHWLRAQRQKSDSKIRWIFCGSIGLDTFTEKLQLSGAFNDVPKYSIGAFEYPVAVAFLKKLGDDNSLPLATDNITAIIDLIGWPLPFFLQAHFKQLKRLKNAQGNIIVRHEDIQQAYQNILQDAQALKTWEERLDLQLKDDDATYCKIILTNICKHKKGLARKKLFDLLYRRINDTDKCDAKLSFCLSLLERDGYIICEEKNYAFRSPLLRDFWYNLKVK